MGTRFGRLVALPGILAIVYLAWVFGSRWIENRRYRERAPTANLADQYRGTALKILEFYSPQTNLICYGVLNAKRVNISPEPGDVAPSLSRCVDVHATGGAKFVLTAKSADGTTASRTVIIGTH